MKTILIHKALVVVAALAGIVVVGSFVVANGYASKAQLVQRVEVDKTADALFGDTPSSNASGNNTPIGSPQKLIIEDQKAFLPGSGPDGARLVDEKYLNDHKLYPLQLQTVEFVASQVRLGGLIVLVLSALGAFFAKKKSKTA